MAQNRKSFDFAQDRELVERLVEWPGSSLFKHLQRAWTPVFTGVTNFYETVIKGFPGGTRPEWRQMYKVVSITLI